MCFFFHFTQKFKMAAKNAGKRFLAKKWQFTSQIPWCQEFPRNLTIPEILNSFYFHH